MTVTSAMRAAATAGDPRWAAVMARDPTADGKFFYSVATTGVYCRPSCAARTPRPENVAFHATAAEAEQAGFRPCRRCQPDQPPLAERQAALVADLCRMIENAERAPSLQELADHAGLSTCHLHRVFRTVTGLTPREYASARRAGRVRA
ncbi:MAG: methylphosphotriester-DNA--protein-cysteine methyltransferase family protein, partial [Sulfuritalea sp.]|nr:methylphosphotriester-DNA--protein-cysteine methyltransferase family protein [Sulfuritalea sp.]